MCLKGMSVHDELKVGLVLSGGGAKGAYQAGVVKGLVEMGAQVDMVAGASIGALNGAVLACSGSLAEAAARLENLWMTLANETPISAKNPLGTLSYLALLAAAGLEIKTALLIGQRVAKLAGVSIPGIGGEAVLCDKPLQALMDKYLDIASLANGLPLYVSVFEGRGGLLDIAGVLAAETGLTETPDSRFIHIQSLPETMQKNVLLASAALPVLYQPRQMGGRHYSDGGQGGWNRAQGNTPITPLLDAGCNMVIVTHLSDGSLWSRHDFPEATILEIRPQTSIARDTGLFGGAKDLLGFDSARISSWIEQGYRDTLHCVGRVMKSTRARNELRSSEQTLKSSQQQGMDADALLAEAMSQLKK